MPFPGFWTVQSADFFSDDDEDGDCDDYNNNQKTMQHKDLFYDDYYDVNNNDNNDNSDNKENCINRNNKNINDDKKQ